MHVIFYLLWCVAILERGFGPAHLSPILLTFFKYKVMYKMADKEMIRFAGTLLCRHHSLTFIFFIAIATSAQI